MLDVTYIFMYDFSQNLHFAIDINLGTAEYQTFIQ